jgi:hypothetical protein
MSDKIVWAHDEENYSSDSLHDLIRDYDLKAGAMVHSGVAYHPSPSMFVDADDVIEYAQERAYDEFGEYAECFLDGVTDEEKKKLDDFISDWLERNSQITFYSLRDITESIITDLDIVEANHD